MNIENKAVIGTWSLSGDFGHIPMAEVEEILAYSYENGFREFDTAPNYGSGFMEYGLGKIFYGISDIRINTKVGNRPFEGKSFEVEDIKRCVEHSLKRLKIERINTLYYHNPRSEVTDYEPLIKCMEEMKSEGLIYNSGISCAKNFDYSIEVLNNFDEVQNDFNPLFINPLEQGLSHSTKFVARSPLASGILSGNLSLDSDFPPEDHRSGWLKGERLESLLKRVNILQSVREDLSISEISKKFVLSVDFISKVIFGIKRKSHVDLLLRDLQGNTLDTNTIEEIIRLCNRDFGLKNERHLGY